jgi:AmiR/NasT family two-component response regulator
MIEGAPEGDDDACAGELDAARVEIDQLQQALDSRLVIGQAEGIMMASLGVEPEQAIEYLKRVSSVTNRKVVDIAAEIAETKQLPELDVAVER